MPWSQFGEALAILQLGKYVVPPIFLGEWSDNISVLRMNAYGFALTWAGVPVEFPAHLTLFVTPPEGSTLMP
jgi:hypothetical protein